MTAQWVGGEVVSPVVIHSEAGAALLLAKPWPTVCVREKLRPATTATADGAGADSNSAATVATVAAVAGTVGPVVGVLEEAGLGLADVDPDDRARFPTEAGKTYLVEQCGGNGASE